MSERHDRYAHLDRRTPDPILRAVEDNTAVTQALLKRVEELEKGHELTKEQNKEILDVLYAAQGGFKVLGFLATVAKYLTMIGAFGLFVWGLVHPSSDIKHPLK